MPTVTLCSPASAGRNSNDIVDRMVAIASAKARVRAPIDGLPQLHAALGSRPWRAPPRAWQGCVGDSTGRRHDAWEPRPAVISHLGRRSARDLAEYLDEAIDVFFVVVDVRAD